MKSGTVFEQGEILIVPFPFTDLSGIKQRPVLVISKTEDNKNSDDIITCGITSYLRNVGHSVLIDNKDLAAGKIPKASRIKVDKIFTLEKGIVKKKIARLNKEILDKVREEFNKLV